MFAFANKKSFYSSLSLTSELSDWNFFAPWSKKGVDIYPCKMLIFYFMLKKIKFPVPF